MSIKTPRLIRDRCGVFYFRYIVPLAWRVTIQKKEIRRSLRTKDANTARHAALLLSAQLEIFMAKSKAAAKEQTLLDKQGEELLAFMHDSTVHKMLVRYFPNGEMHVETDTPEEARAARAIVADHAKMRALATQAVDVLPSSRCGTTLAVAKADYELEKKSTLAASTLAKHRGVLKAFIAFKGNVDVAMVRPEDVATFKSRLLEDERAATTINDQITILHNFFEYCINNKQANMVNPAAKLHIEGAANLAESYKPFDDDELRKMFEPTLYLRKMRQPDLYWGPLLALFSGARAEEIASLDLAQIKAVKGVWIINILKGKTANAVRRIPIHDELIALGFLDYVDCLRVAGYKKLFPHLQDGKNGYKKNMCRTFGNYLDHPRVDIVDPLKVFHSFRHTVVTALTGKGVNEGLKRAMVGHDIFTVTDAHVDYTHIDKLTVPELQTAINKLKYESLRLSALKLPADAFLPVIAKRIAEREAANARKSETLK
ncbi:DUF6538 domain-containing protein [Duganella sp. PWIR1]